MTNIPNYQEVKAEAERLADELANIQKKEALHLQALLALADEHPDFPLAPVVMKALSRHHEAALPATPGWARIHPVAVADREVLRLMGAHRLLTMSDAEQVALVLEAGDGSAAVNEEQRRMAPIMAEREEYRRKQAHRELELQAARKWVWDQQAMAASLSSARADASAAKAIDAAGRERNRLSYEAEEQLLEQYRSAINTPLQGVH